MSFLFIDPSFNATAAGVGQRLPDGRMALGKMMPLALKPDKSRKDKRSQYERDAEWIDALFLKLVRFGRRYDVRAVCREVPAGAQSARSAACMAYASGVAICTASALGVPRVDVTADAVRKRLLDHQILMRARTAVDKKLAVRAAVEAYFGRTIRPEDETDNASAQERNLGYTDAIAVGLACVGDPIIMAVSQH